MAWEVRINKNENDHFAWPYIFKHEWPYIVIASNVQIDEIFCARIWCEENNIPFNRIFSGMCFKSQDHVTEFMLRWG